MGSRKYVGRSEVEWDKLNSWSGIRMEPGEVIKGAKIRNQ